MSVFGEGFCGDFFTVVSCLALLGMATSSSESIHRRDKAHQ